MQQEIWKEVNPKGDFDLIKVKPSTYCPEARNNIQEAVGTKHKPTQVTYRESQANKEQVIVHSTVDLKPNSNFLEPVSKSPNIGIMHLCFPKSFETG